METTNRRRIESPLLLLAGLACICWLPMGLTHAATPASGTRSEVSPKVPLPDGSPVADVAVSLVGHPGSTRTDREGRFTWLPDPPLPVAILVVLPSGQYLGPVLVRVAPAAVEMVTVTTRAAPHVEAPPASSQDATHFNGGTDEDS